MATISDVEKTIQDRKKKELVVRKQNVAEQFYDVFGIKIDSREINDDLCIIKLPQICSKHSLLLPFVSRFFPERSEGKSSFF